MILTFSIFIAILLQILYATGNVRKKNVCLLIGIMTFLLLGMRSTTTGGDTYLYYNDFLRINVNSLSRTIANSPMKDTGFIVFEWLVKRIGGTFRTVLLINGGLLGIAIGKYFYKRSDNPGLSYILLFSFNIFQFCLSGLRQTFAIAFFMFALMTFEERKYIKTIILILIAGSFHLSAFILVVLPLLQLLFKNSKYIEYSIPVMFAVFLLRNQIAPVLSNALFSITDRMSVDAISDGAGTTTAIVVMVVYVFAALFAVRYCDNNSSGTMDFTLMSFAVLFESLVPGNSIFFRIAFYTLWTISIFVPRIIKEVFAKENQLLVSIVAYAIALVMYFGFTMNSVVGGYHFLG